MNYKHIGAVLASALLLAGCLMGPNYKQPDLDLPTGEAADNFSIFTMPNGGKCLKIPL